MLPDSNANEPESHGLVQFRIVPKAPLVAGTVIANNADIFFDLNDPIRTNDAAVTVETSTGMEERDANALTVFPSPTEGLLNVWSDMPLRAVAVIALDGRVVIERSVNGAKAVLDLSALPAGLYVLNARGADGSLRQHRIVRR
ncbi:MAG TPA: T9SS type A sorting domain-containing protein [Flavobacteriales bacterium]|nr:T9SS type A sorting domain-containing protein [Flavobacteriales bacterium]